MVIWGSISRNPIWSRAQNPYITDALELGNHHLYLVVWCCLGFQTSKCDAANVVEGTGVGFMAAYSATRCARSQNHLLPGRPRWCHVGIPGLKENWNVGTLFHLHVIFHFFDAPTAAGPWISDDLKVFFWKLQHVDYFWTTFNQVEICKCHRQIFGRWSRWPAICDRPSVWWIVRKGITSFHVAINVEIFTRTGTTASRISVQKILMSDIFWYFLVFLSKLVWETTNMDWFLIGKKRVCIFCFFVT